MKLEKLLDKKGLFTELVRITDYTSRQECIDAINEFFDLTNDEYPYYTDEEDSGKKYNYVYLTGDGQLCFVESLDEFSESHRTEQEWGVVHSIYMN
jgi:hypothetical protein